MPAELTKPARLGPSPATQSVLDRSVSQRTPPTHPPKQKPLDRANTTRAPASKSSPPQPVPMAQSSSQQGHPTRGPPGGVPQRQPTNKQPQQGGATPRRRDKQKENEEVIRQLQAICSPGDPNQVYRNLQKIGQGRVVRQHTCFN